MTLSVYEIPQLGFRRADHRLSLIGFIHCMLLINTVYIYYTVFTIIIVMKYMHIAAPQAPCSGSVSETSHNHDS